MNRNTLVCYEDVRDVFLSRKESVFPMATHLDIGNNYIHNVKTPINNDQGANKSYIDQHVAKTGDTMSGNLNMDGNKIKGSQSGDEATSKDYVLILINSVSSVFLDHAGSLPVTGSLHIGNKKIINLANPSNNADAANKAYIDDHFLKLSGGTLTGTLYLEIIAHVTLDEALNVRTATAYFVQIGNPYVETRFIMVNHKIINLADPTDDKDAVNKQFLEQEIQKSRFKASHKTDQFAYLMQNTLEWPDVTPGGNSFNMTKIADLSPEQGNIHSYNHKVIYTAIIKNSQGGYKYKMGIQCFRLTKEVDYTLCIEILITVYPLWHKSSISIDKTPNLKKSMNEPFAL